MPSQHGAWTLGTKLMEDVPTLGAYLRKADYRTSLIGKAHFQPTLSTPEYPCVESEPIIRDLEYWRKFHGPWYGFDHIEIMRNHGDQWSCGQHYALWMEQAGLDNWRDYFPDRRGDASARERKGYYDPDRRRWHLPEKYHYNRFIAEKTIEQLEGACRDGKPFFCWASFPDPHPPYLVPEPWCDMYDPHQVPTAHLTPGEHEKNPPHFRLTQDPRADEKLREMFEGDGAVHGAHAHRLDPQDVKRNTACYYALISFMDRHIGLILNALDRLNLTENTLVVFTTDHGHYLGHHGLYNKAIHHYEDLLRVPMIIRRPGRVAPGRTCPDLQNLVDLAPSFLSAAGVEIPFHMTGKDATSNWSGGPAVRDYSITENHHGYSKAFLHTYVEERYKLTVYRAWSHGELFDLHEDPEERNNLWDDPASQALKLDLLLKFHQARMDSEQMRMPRIAGA
jgi:uncharacterized sulfatase